MTSENAIASSPASGDHAISFTTRNDGVTHVALKLKDQKVSECEIIPFTIRIGAATVRMDGIGGVETEKEFRNRGYARILLDAAIDRMTSGDAAISTLFGISGLYQKFGYATAGPESSLEIPGPFAGSQLPQGWTARPIIPDDIPTLQKIYDRCTSHAVGAIVRHSGSYPWRMMIDGQADGSDEGRVVVSPDGHVSGYAWKGKKHWAVHHSLIPKNPDALVLGEAIAEDREAAIALLALCRLWADEESRQRSQPVNRVFLPLPPEGHLAAAAMRENATFQQRFTCNGEFMVRVLSVQRLFEAIELELARRVQSARPSFEGMVRFETELGSASVRVSADGLTVVNDGTTEKDSMDRTITIRLPSPELGRLAFGAFPPEDVLGSLPEVPPDEAGSVLELLFPRRTPHLFHVDHF